MSTQNPSVTLEQALSGVPSTFRDRLIATYTDLKRNHAESRFEAAGIAAGKFCEVALRLLQHEVLGAHTKYGKKFDNFADECRKLVTANSTAVETLRIVIPRCLVFMYTMRNKRGIGHVGGDVEANQIDSSTLARLADWTVCELIRIYHGLPLEEAQGLVDALAFRELPHIWEVAGKRRVITVGLTAQQQTLLLLYSEPTEFVLSEDLCSWVEYSSISDYRRKVLQPLHTKRFVEFDRDIDAVYLSPSGSNAAEAILAKHR